MDNIAALAIERVLLRDLTDLILANCEPSNLSDDELESVAGESAEVKEQRNKAVHRIAALEAVIKTCREYKGINQSTPQKSLPMQRSGSGSASVVDSDASDDEESDGQEHLSSKFYVKLSRTEEGTKPESPTTPKPSRSKDQDELSPLSPGSSSSSGFRSAKSNGSTNTPLSSMGSASPGQQHNNATGSIAYRSASRKKKVLYPSPE